ncbi:Aminoglycoside phosphotransferase [Penicillium mononematosum]|uniref:Aminoglycoside phosphotransferase n=1 Tax=Penicillium mononematosum TaxID=268346 RepID=UPI0025488931|nr:Aminoglycoside phosphotransferase [Penicillium mononematosum]KAJ6179136.1 Aminoglycoside phosphotransferase [Penicillium mononematosum]
MRMTPDDLVWEQAEEISDKWLLQFLQHDVLRSIGAFIITHERGFVPKQSYYAYCDPLGTTWRRHVPEEKVANEVAIMRFLADQTLIPIPLILHSGTKKESPLELGPFIMMEYVEHDTKMYAALNTPGCPVEVRGMLDPDIDKGRLELLYSQLAHILLQLSVPSLPRIGSLSQIDEFTSDVTRRPLTINMNELVRIGGLPQSKLPDLNATFEASSSYMEALANINIEHLVHQRNDSVKSADDCRRKFVARQLFRKLAREKKLTNPLLEKWPFRIWCGDLRPANVLLNENPTKIAGVVDWEFTYAAPVEFFYAPPWWLLIEKPELWPKGIDDWKRVFEHRLKTSFLKAMKDCEDTAIQQGRLREDQRLSGPMYESWESGDFWIMYAATHSFAFDEIYWHKIDPRFFGPTKDPEGVEAWKETLCLLDEEEKEEMELLVARKLMEMDTRVLLWDPDEYTLAFHEQLKSQEKAKVENSLEESMDSEPTDETR